MLFFFQNMFRIAVSLLITVFLSSSYLSAGENNFPAQELETLDGERMTLTKDSAAQFTVLDFWALWCAPCLEALPDYEEMINRLSDRPVRFILVNCDNTRSRAKVRSFIRAKGIQTQVLLDPTQAMSRHFGISTWPHLIVLDSTGNVVDRKSGYMPGDELIIEKKLLELLEE